MAEKEIYQFLRYELPGLFVFLYWIVAILFTFGTIPFPLSLDLFLIFGIISYPLGYSIHQLILVGSFKPDKRKSYQDLKTKLGIEELDDSLQISLLNVCFFYNKNIETEPLDKIKIFELCGARWNHFFARREVGVVAPLFALGFWGLTFVWFNSLPIYWVYAILYWLGIFCVGGLLFHQSEQLRQQVDYLERIIVNSIPDADLKSLSNKFINKS